MEIVAKIFNCNYETYKKFYKIINDIMMYT